MKEIEDILSQRSDLSTFLVHLTRDRAQQTALDVLKAILQDRMLEARSAFGQAIAGLKKACISTDSQRCVCFTETPLVHLHLLVGDIRGRNVSLKPFGVVIPKKVGRRSSVNPVWYLDQTPNAPGWLSIPLNELIDEAIQNHAKRPFEQHPVAKIAPFVEQMGTWPNSQGAPRKEFWWEREWRKLGDLRLPENLIVLAPEAEHVGLRLFIASLPAPVLKCHFIDASWSLEQTIGSLAGFQKDDLGL